MMEGLIRAGMNVARLNFSHGDFDGHRQVIERLRAAAAAAGRRLAIMADLPGPKMRIGQLAEERVTLTPGATFTLTTDEVVGDATRASVSFAPLPRVVEPGDTLFLNDGIIQLRVGAVSGADVTCRVVVGGELGSRKGLNLPGIDLGISAFTPRDRECLAFALAHGVDAVSQSFVASAADVHAVREAAASMGHQPFVIAKIERAGALDHIDEILDAADGMMIARGDLGVEIPIERVALVQKRLTRQANLRGKPVITATQMLESMIDHARPTRAEASDVANAVYDGTDAVMLSGESAMGRFPVESVSMLARIAATVEPYRPAVWAREQLLTASRAVAATLEDVVAFSVESAVERVAAAAVVVPTRGGTTVRSLSRFRLPVWIVAVCDTEAVCQHLQFSYGVEAVHEPETPEDWKAFARAWLAARGLDGQRVVLAAGPSARHPNASHRMEILEL